ncbi:hypothetical protein os4_08550 [Comamonadaceae bacterium OS-4]|nr:hypothetical protein os4_08550 [Comamonadaceae bacterium OS-4]
MTHKLNLHLEDEFMRIVESGTDQGTTFQIPLLRMSEQFFHQGSLTASALEHAIEWTEDRLQLAKFTKPDAASLLTNDPQVKRLYQAAGIKDVEGAHVTCGRCGANIQPACHANQRAGTGAGRIALIRGLLCKCGGGA